MMKKKNIFKKELLFFLLLLFSVFSTFSTASFSKKSASFFLVQEKIIEEEIDSEIWPLSNNLIILLFFLIIIFIIYTLCVIFPIPKKEDKFLFANPPLYDVPVKKRLSFIIGEKLLIQNMPLNNNKENNINDVDSSDDDSFESNKRNYFFNEKDRNDLLLELEKAEKSKDNSLGIDLNNANKLDTKKIADYKKKAEKYFDFLPENMLLIDGIIKSYESSTEEDDYGGANLVFDDVIEEKKINEETIKELGGYNNGQGKNILYGDILGIGAIKNKNTNNCAKNKTEVAINKNKFFVWMMYFVREKIILKKFSEIKNDKKQLMKKNTNFVDSKILKDGLKEIVKKLTYISPGDNSKEKKAKRGKALEKFINFFLVILYYFFCSNYRVKFNEEPSFFNPKKEEEIKLSFSSVARQQKRLGFFNSNKGINFKFTLDNVHDQYGILLTGEPVK